MAVPATIHLVLSREVKIICGSSVHIFRKQQILSRTFSSRTYSVRVREHINVIALLI
jgi:hypothetical protein